jgi:putative N6-adenine-specific DNA methylase
LSTPFQSPLEKRIRRHVIAREHAFFASTCPGLEGVLCEEIKALSISREDTAASAGGVEFRGFLKEGYLANLKLRTALRVLMRIGHFKATNFRQLAKKVSSIPWELFLTPATVPEARVSTAHSRLHHTEAIGELVIEGVRRRLSEKAPQNENPDHAPRARIFVRSVNDRFTLSLDSSGELLYKRGIKTHRARAPLRETIAAAGLLLAGYDGSRPLVDPLCGSGTFSLEAALMVRNMPPGWFREFAFFNWPAFRPRQWAYLRKETAKGFVSPLQQPCIFASDIDRKVCSILRKTLREIGFSDTIEVSRADFFRLSPPSFPSGPGIVTINPPYGRRMGGRRQSDILFREICRKLKKDYRGWTVALVVPARHLLKEVPFQLHIYPFDHGGLHLMLLIGIIT